jgi:glycosyltransferase involved in cell wall biosynthesis
MAKTELITAALNRLEYTIDCVKGIHKKAGTIDYRHIVVDQNSTDGTTQWLESIMQEGYYKIYPVFNKINTGDAGGLSDGLAVISEDCQYVMHFGNDCAPVSDGFLQKLVSVMDNNPDIGAIMPKRTGVKNILIPEKVEIIDGLQMGTLPENKNVVCAIMRRSLLDEMPEPRRDGERIGWVQAQTKKMKAAGYKVYKCLDVVINHIDGTDGQHKKYPSYFSHKTNELSNFTDWKYENVNSRRFSTRIEFDEIGKENKYYVPNRFAYMNEVISMLKKIKYDSILEIGAYKLRLDKDSVVMDIDNHLPGAVIHDANIFPWPFADKSFDVICACQVLEYLSDKTAFFKESERISERLILSLPYMWTAGGEDHQNINEDVIFEWFQRKPNVSQKVGCRLIQEYIF